MFQDDIDNIDDNTQNAHTKSTMFHISLHLSYDWKEMQLGFLLMAPGKDITNITKNPNFLHYCIYNDKEIKIKLK